MVTKVAEFTVDKGEVESQVLGDHASYVTFTLTGPTTYTTIYTEAFRPGRAWQAFYPINYQCCMDCYVYFPQVEVFYWPVPESEEQCANGSQPLVTAQAVLPTGAARTAEARMNTLFSNSSLTGPITTVNADGFTFVSPSVYVAFGDVSAGDACGAVGQKHTSITLGFAPGELQTVTALGKDHYDTTLHTRAFDPRNILCPPDFKPEELFVQQDSLAGINTYRPRIQIPPALQNLDPKWSSCIVDPYEGIDPPRQLVPASGFADDPVPLTTATPPQQATPAGAGPSLPKNTGTGDGSQTTSPLDPQKDSHSPMQGASGGAASDPHNGVEPSDQPNGKSDPGQPGGNHNGQVQNDPQANTDPTKATNGQGQPGANAPQEPRPQPAQPAVVVAGQTIKQGAAPVTIGGQTVIYSKGSVYVGGAAAAAPTAGPGPQAAAKPGPKPAPVELDGFKFTPIVQQQPAQNNAAKPAQSNDNKPAQLRPAVIVEGQTVHQDAPPVTINGQEVSYSGNAIHVGNDNAPIAPAQPNQPAKPLEVQGMTFTPVTVAPPPPTPPNQADFPNKPIIVIKGQTLRENGPAATINGRPVVYSAGNVYAAGTKVSIPTLHPGDPPTKPFNVAGLVITPQPIAPPPSNGVPAVVVSGHTLTANAPAIFVNGATLAYSNNNVYVNGKAAPMPTPHASRPQVNNNPQINAPIIIGGLTVLPGPQQKNTAAAASPTPIVTLAPGQTIYRNQFNNVILPGGVTLFEGSPSITISGTAYSLLGSTALLVDSSTIPLPAITAPPSPSTHSSSVLRDAAGHTFTLAPGSGRGVVIAPGMTLSVGGAGATVSGTPYSLFTSAGKTFLIEGTSTLPLTAALASATPIPAPPLTLFGTTIAADSDGAYVLGGKTIKPDGSGVRISGTVISLGHVGSGGPEILVVGSSTTTVLKATGSGSAASTRMARASATSVASSSEGTSGAGGEGSGSGSGGREDTSGGASLLAQEGWLLGMFFVASFFVMWI
ncbi:hypothetical protein Q9189_005513 [Teloschistes chrysophthalmus]